MVLNCEVIEGFIEVKGRYPILITATHGYGTDRFKDVVLRLKELNLYSEFKDVAPYTSAVDFLTGEIAFKVGVAEKCWVILPTVSKVDYLSGLPIPDYNLNREYASITPFWRRVEELVRGNHVRFIIDIHGMKSVNKWPDFCISCANYTTASKKTVEHIVHLISEAGFTVKVDRPFKGGSFIRHFGKPPRIEAIGLEIKRDHRFLGSRIPYVIRRIAREIIRFKNY